MYPGYPGWPPVTLQPGYLSVTPQPRWPPATPHPGWPSVTAHPVWPSVTSHPGWPSVTPYPGWPSVTPHSGWASVTPHPGWPPVHESPSYWVQVLERWFVRCVQFLRPKVVMWMSQDLRMTILVQGRTGVAFWGSACRRVYKFSASRTHGARGVMWYRMHYNDTHALWCCCCCSCCSSWSYCCYCCDTSGCTST